MASIVAVPACPVPFGEKLAASGRFDALFRDGMALVEDTAAYLDGEGRAQSRHLGRVAALAYASESMRLTTRLMQIASWLLLQRAVNEGEMSADEASADKRRARFAWQALPTPAQEAAAQETSAQEAARLPAALLALIGASLDLQNRIQRLDTMICEPAPPSVAPSALDAQRARLHRAFPDD